MPRLPVLSGAEIIKLLERVGFEQVRHRGSHVVALCAARICIVPLHREVKTGKLARILRQAGGSIEELISVQ